MAECQAMVDRALYKVTHNGVFGRKTKVEREGSLSEGLSADLCAGVNVVNRIKERKDLETCPVFLVLNNCHI